MLEKDEIGVPSTLGAILFNGMQLMGVELVNVVFTWIISILSIIYLVYKIKNEKKTHDRRKDDREDSNSAS
jgi:uncharacterized membrane protein